MATTIIEQTQTHDVPKQLAPPLMNGDRLTRSEFILRSHQHPDLAKAERLEGIVYMQAAVRHQQHGQPHSNLMGWLVQYSALTFGTETGDNSTVFFDEDNDLQPDCFLRIVAECGGRSHVNEDGYLVGPPELIAEVAASSASYDLHSKMNVYRRSGVLEYIVWKVLEKQIDWYRLADGSFVPKKPGENGVINSEVFPGLWLSAECLLAGDMATVLKVLQQGVASDEHAEFVRQLQESSGKQ